LRLHAIAPLRSIPAKKRRLINGNYEINAKTQGRKENQVLVLLAPSRPGDIAFMHFSESGAPWEKMENRNAKTRWRKGAGKIKSLFFSRLRALGTLRLCTSPNPGHPGRRWKIGTQRRGGATAQGKPSPCSFRDFASWRRCVYKLLQIRRTLTEDGKQERKDAVAQRRKENQALVLFATSRPGDVAFINFPKSGAPWQKMENRNAKTQWRNGARKIKSLFFSRLRVLATLRL
jgi:hypothetical protein